MHLSLRSFTAAVSVALVLPSTIVGAQAAASGTSTPVQSAPISGVRYEVTFDPTTAPTRTLRVGMTFDVAGQTRPFHVRARPDVAAAPPLVGTVRLTALTRMELAQLEVFEA